VRSTRGNQQDCVGFGTKPSCRCTTLFASKRGHPLCFIAVAVAKCELSEPRAEHGAAQIAGKAINLAGKNREDDCADADEIRAEALSVEEEDLANDLAAEEETRQNAYAAGDAGWLSDEAAASIASTTIAAAATSTFLTDLVAADVGYVTAAAPLLTSATQAFNNAVDAAYVGAFPGDADQAAVSGAWTAYYNAMATAAQNAMTAEASAYQGYIGSMAGDIQATMNDVASESTQLATDYGNALTGYVSTVAAAATLQTSQTAAAGVVWVDTVATDVKNAVQNAASAWLQMADDGVDAAKALVDDYSNYWNSFAHSYLGAAVAHGTNVINEDRLAAKDIDSQLTALASGVAAEQHDLTLDGLLEGKAASLALSPLDDAVINAWAALESAWSVLTAWFTHADTAAAPVSNFAYAYPGGAGPMSGINHAFDLASNDDEVVMAAVVASSQGSSWNPLNWSIWPWNWEPAPSVNGATLMGQEEGLKNNWKKQRDLLLETTGNTGGMQAATATAGGLGGAALDYAESTAANMTLMAIPGPADDAIVRANRLRKASIGYRSFTAENLRTNLGRLTGYIPLNSHAHHVFPQEFINNFVAAGINPHNPIYGAWWDVATHLSNSRRYADEWRQFLSTAPSQESILQFGREISKRFGYAINF
jgi:hypothetical protein